MPTQHPLGKSGLSIQFNDYDTYQAKPTKLDQLYSHVSQVPIIRVYGSISVPHGQSRNDESAKRQKVESPNEAYNVLVHVHNFYPYIYVDCNEPDELNNPEYLARLTNHLEHILSESFLKSKARNNKDDSDDDDSDPELVPESNKALRKYIAGVSVCKGTPIYGYQVGYRKFYKISLLSPVYKTRLTKLVNEKAINFNLEKSSSNTLNIYESHLSYLLQFLTDFNLFGCGWLDIVPSDMGGPYFRIPILNPVHREFYTVGQISHLIEYLHQHINETNVLANDPEHGIYNRIGRSMLELDISTACISNRASLKFRHLHNDFSELANFKHLQKVVSSANYYRDNKEIYLSSLKHVDNDLKYQLESRDSSFEIHNAPSIYNPSLHPSSFGIHYLGTGSSKWSNQAELDELLQYAIKLNKPTNMTPSEYCKKVLHRKPGPTINSLLGEKVQYTEANTCFDMVDIETHKKFHDYKLKFGSDLIRWGNYHLLYSTQTRDSQLEGSFSRDDLIRSTQKDIQAQISQNQKSTQISESKSDENKAKSIMEISFSSNFSASQEKKTDSEPESVDWKDVTFSEEPEEEGPKAFNDKDGKVLEEVGDEEVKDLGEDEDLDDDLEETQLHELDENVMLELTQKRAELAATESPKLQIRSSFDMSQTDQQVEKQIGNYEVEVPRDLHPSSITKSFDKLGLLKVNYTDPFYANAADMPPKPMIFAHKKLVIPLKNQDSIPSLPMSSKIQEQILHDNQFTNYTSPEIGQNRTNCVWQYAPEPPSKSQVDEWISKEEKRAKTKAAKFRSQIEPGITATHFKFSYNSNKITRRPDDFNNLTNFYLEIHTNTDTRELLPNPSTDAITLMFYHFDDSNNMFEHTPSTSGILLLNTLNISEETINALAQGTSIPIKSFTNETEMVLRLLTMVQLFDPDILSGYEVNASSWGYVVERFRSEYDINILAEISRGSYKSNGKFGDRWGYTHTSNLRTNGRHIINVWRILRSELSLTSYTFERVCYELLHQTFPSYSNLQLSDWLRSGVYVKILTVLMYYVRRMDLTLKLISVQEIISRNVEHSRLIGVDFYSNFYRGSQYKVESILSRITKQESLMLNSPSKDQVHKMRSIECIPLIMEPESNFYKSPLVVLDFQSLYPSIMIAYNYCYSTLIGRLHNFRPNKNNVGYLKHSPLPDGIIDLLFKEDAINLSPNGYMFVKSNVRKSAVAKMLEEILNTRLAVKSLMKLFKNDSELHKLYNARQLALKLIANVTYGYTSATFSGRMPNSDVADAIVSTGREILSKSIELIESGNFGAKVFYGDTDSLFVYFPGKSKADAFSIGKQLAEYITNQFPDPVTLKFEKVYHPCVLLAKKRYVGYSYEYEDQKVGTFNAKGIETVRRDGIPAQQKIVEKALRILFESKNLSEVKNYVMSQFSKILFNKVSVSDFCFAKEVRYGTYKNEMYLPPGAIIAEKQISKDPRKEPQYRERVAYVVIQDSSKPRIKDRCMPPEDFISTLQSSNPLRLDYEYYITRVLVPPLERIFNLLGVNVKGWYQELPKFINSFAGGAKGGVMDVGYIRSNSCINCGGEVVQYPNTKPSRLCSNCRQNESQLLASLCLSQKHTQLKLMGLESQCDGCVTRNLRAGNGINKHECVDSCMNLSCAVFHRKVKVKGESVTLAENLKLLNF